MSFLFAPPLVPEFARAFVPEMALVAGALMVLGADLSVGRGKALRWRVGCAAALGVVSVAGALAGLLLVGNEGGAAAVFKVSRVAVAGLGGLAVLVLGGTSRVRNPAEQVALMLFALAGLLLMIVAKSLLTIFLALELAGLSLYVLAGFDKARRESAEAGLKYFLFGGMAAAFLLFGFSLLYGLTGAVDLEAVRRGIAEGPGGGNRELLAVAGMMVFVGLAYKTALAPFHHWAPDVYAGAPAASGVLIASASKVAGFVLMLRLWEAFGVPGATVLWVLAGCSIVAGNAVALAQGNVRRLLAYSAIAHAGVMVMSVAAGHVPVLEFYAVTYGLATAGAFAVVAVVEASGRCREISDLNGLWKRSRLLTACLMVCVLSLAGVPPLAGFLGKFRVFAQVLARYGSGGAAFWMVLLAVASSAVALYYYLRILKAAFVCDPAPGAEAKIKTPVAAAVALVAASVALVALGVAPWLLEQLASL
ncbi:MAG: NADH-quinone oxidoreductase subunit N [Puniceicoccales bacterium]|jgi:NADH-quinone oxidoreductase subunit N|nr:NADH-quinone oxidoreductase subunit N [Puniceicoccales bacterium]